MTKFSEIFSGFMRKGTYVLDECPFCSGRMTAMFSGNFTLFECNECGKIMDYEAFMDEMRKDIFYEPLISSVQDPSAPEGILDIADIPDHDPNAFMVPSGFGELDKMTGGFKSSEITIVSGKRRDGKSTFCGQLSLNMIDSGRNLFVYSGELSAIAFRNWIFTQAAGPDFLEPYENEFGGTRYKLDKYYAEPRIREWLRDKLKIYDNKIIKTSEHNTIIDRAKIAHEYYGCEVFLIDNLKTARFKKDNERDYFRKQANFVCDMLAFAQQTNTHIIIVAHPKKEDTGDSNDNVSGLSDITDIVHYVLTIKRLRGNEKLEQGCDSILDLSKNRGDGEEGLFKMDFDVPSRRFTFHKSNDIKRYGWEG